MNGLFITATAVGLVVCGGFLIWNGGPPASIVHTVASVTTLNSVQEWEHGFKTNVVIATRRSNADKTSWSADFDFPNDTNDGDRAELSDLIEAYGGGVYEVGGYPGAPLRTRFDGVDTKEKMSAKLREVLPPLTDLMLAMRSGVGSVDITPFLNNEATARLAEKNKPENRWPNTTKDEFEHSLGMVVNDQQYKVKEVSPGKYQWVEDMEAEEASRREEAHRQSLYDALSTRVLSDNELKEAMNYGSFLNIQAGMPYYEKEKTSELTAAFERQRVLREVAQKGANP